MHNRLEILLSGCNYCGFEDALMIVCINLDNFLNFHLFHHVILFFFFSFSYGKVVEGDWLKYGQFAVYFLQSL